MLTRLLSGSIRVVVLASTFPINLAYVLSCVCTVDLAMFLAPALDTHPLGRLGPGMLIWSNVLFFFFFEPILFWNTGPWLSPVVTMSHYICKKCMVERR
jgi:hypothetical protein